MVKKIITDISEEDFRKLNLVVKRNTLVKCPDGGSRYAFVEMSLNKKLDEEIGYLLENGYEEDLEALKYPVTIAIHEDGGYYLDKFMNRFTGAQTFQFAFGIKHLYSTRDYYEDHDDYWRVSKKETKVIYRITLDNKYIESFVVKHKTVNMDWPYDFLPEGVKEGYDKAILSIHYDLSPDGEVFIEKSRTACFRYGAMSTIFGVDKSGERIKSEWKDHTGPVN